MQLSSAELEIHRGRMKPVRSRPYIAIAIPSSVTADAKTLREQTIKVGYIGRALAVFRVEEVMVYSDGVGGPGLVHSLLEYMEIPPYLKKALAPLRPELRFAGLIPPLKAPHHVEPEVFDTLYREGLVIRRYEDRCLVEVGLGKKGIVYGRCPPMGSRATFKIVGESSRYYYLEIVDRGSVDVYWGYTVKVFNSLSDLLSHCKHSGYLIVVASKKGVPMHRIEKGFVEDLMKRDRALVVFGGPYLDVDEVASAEGLSLSDFVNYVVNFVPRQGTVNIRTEEAVIATLSLINYVKEKYFEGHQKLLDRT